MSRKIPQEIADQMVLPVIAAPMFLVSSPEMVVGGCKEGVIGSFPAQNARTTEILEDWMKRITDGLAGIKEEDPTRRVAPWAINLIVHRSNQRFEKDLELIQKYQTPIVITSLGDPSLVVQKVHGYGGLVFSDVISLTHARKAAQKGVDGLILVSNGAGGHGGTLNPMAFVTAVREFWDGILILAGCISRGQDILAAKALGADLVSMGTRFITTTESMASSEYQNMLIEATIDDILYTDAFRGVKGNYLIPSIRKAGLDPDQLEKKDSVDFSRSGSSTEIKPWKHIWSAGQGVGAVKETESIASLVKKLKREYNQALSSLMEGNS